MSGTVQETSGRRGKLSGDEFLSDLKKEDRLHPIISLIIYYGETGWDGPCSLHDMIFDMPEEIQAVFSDYPMNLLEVRDSGKYLFHNPDVRTVFEISREAMAGISMRYEKNTGIYRSILNC